MTFDPVARVSALVAAGRAERERVTAALEARSAVAVVEVEERPRPTKCRECDPDGLDAGWYERVGCIDGEVYGECGSPHCYGLCSYDGDCRCTCHDSAIPSETPDHLELGVENTSGGNKS